MDIRGSVSDGGPIRGTDVLYRTLDEGIGSLISRLEIKKKKTGDQRSPVWDFWASNPK